MDKIKIITRLDNHEMNAKEFIQYCKRFVVNLKNNLPFDFTLATWDDEEDKIFNFKNDLSDFNEDNLHKIIIVNKEEDVFKNIDSSITLKLDSKNWIGFNSLLYLKSNVESEISDVSISITQGSYENKSAILNIEFSDAFIEKIDNNILTKIIYCIELNGDLNYATVISNEFRRKVKKSGQNLWIGYLTYFKNIDSTIFPDFMTLNKLDNGVIIDLGNNFEVSPENIEKATTIRDILSEDILSI